MERHIIQKRLGYKPDQSENVLVPENRKKAWKLIIIFFLKCINV